MAAQDFFVMHGEKVVVGVVGAACVYLILNAFTNDGIRPTSGGEGGISATTIKEDIAFVDGYRPKAKEPILKPVPDYAGRMKNDFTRIIPAPPLMAWVTAHPDMGRAGAIIGSEVLSYIYVYELLAPTLTVKDAIGSFEVGVTLAQPQRTSERLVDKDEAKWGRKATEGQIDSSADIVGALIERQVGKGQWEPVNDGKLLAFSDFKTGVSIPTVDYETYGFRARLVARATGYGFGVPGGEVMVANGRWIGLEAEPTEADFLKLMGAVNTRNQAVLSKFVRPTMVADMPALASVELKGRENLYLGPQNDATVLRAQSAVKFQLLKLDPDPADPSKSTATLLLTKLLRANGKEGWVEMQQYKTLKPGVKLGDDTRKLDDPTDDETLRVPIDLSTPFELVRVDKDVKRVYYHELKLVARKDGKPGKEFELRSKEKTTDTATFKNTRTGEVLVLAKLERLTRPNSPDAMITPDLVPVDEKEEFEKDSGGFAQQELLPALPTMHQPDTGPLEDLFKKGKKSAKTDTPYYEMPDGRLYYYEPNNKLVPPDVWKLGVTPKPKVELPKPEPKATPAPTPAPAGTGHKPTIPEPGIPPGGHEGPRDILPPGGIPPGGMPPGMMPGGQGGPGIPVPPGTGQPTTPRRR